MDLYRTENDQPAAPKGAGMLVQALGLSTLLLFYTGIAWLKFGGDSWWHADALAGNLVSWGDDAYRYFLASRAWHNPDLYFFNFMLPGQIVLDGALFTVTGGSLFLICSVRALLATLAVWLVYRALLACHLSAFAAGLASIILALHPAFLFVSLSFYGESWLIFLVSLALYLACAGRTRPLWWVIALMPLLRIEGLWLVMAVFATGLWQRDWRQVIIPALPGFLYFLLVLVVGPGIGGFLEWRAETIALYAQVPGYYGGSLDRLFEAYHWLWWLAGFAGLFVARRKGLPVGVFGFMALVVSGHFVGRLLQIPWLGPADFEARYVAIVTPILAFGIAVLVDWVLACRHDWIPRNSLPLASGVLALWLIGHHALSVDAPRSLLTFYQKHGQFPPVVRERPWWPGAYFFGLEQAHLQQYQDIARFVRTALEKNKGIDTVAVADVRLFYFLARVPLPEGVRAVFVPFPWSVQGPLFDGGAVAGYFDLAPYSAAMRLIPPADGTRQLLYVGKMGVPEYPFQWQVHGQSLLLFGRQTDALISSALVHSFPVSSEGE